MAKKKTAKKPKVLTEIVSLYRFGLAKEYGIERKGRTLGTISQYFVHRRAAIPCRKYEYTRARLTIEFLLDEKKK